MSIPDVKRETEIRDRVVGRLPHASEAIETQFKRFADITKLLSNHLPDYMFEDMTHVSLLRNRIRDVLENISKHQEEQTANAFRIDIHAFEQLHMQFANKITDLLQNSNVNLIDVNLIDDVLNNLETLQKSSVELKHIFQADIKLLNAQLKQNRRRLEMVFEQAHEHYEKVDDFQKEARRRHDHFDAQHHHTHDKIDSMQRVIGFTTLFKFGYEAIKFGLCVYEAVLEG